MISRGATLLVLGLVAASLTGCGNGGGDTGARAASTTAPTVAPTTTAPPAPPVTTPPTTAPPAFTAEVAPVTAAELGASWREGCPVGPDQLRSVAVTYWNFEGTTQRGTLVVHAEVADAIATAFRQLFEARVPFRRIEPVDRSGASDDASMAADNTSAFNCRLAVTAGPAQWSVHAFGRAIDVNPVENPYVLGGEVVPPAGAAYTDRADVRPGMAVAGEPLVEAFVAIGWEWGGRWAGSPDYQHFSADGG